MKRHGGELSLCIQYFSRVIRYPPFLKTDTRIILGRATGLYYISNLNIGLQKTTEIPLRKDAHI